MSFTTAVYTIWKKNAVHKPSERWVCYQKRTSDSQENTVTVVKAVIYKSVVT